MPLKIYFLAAMIMVATNTPKLIMRDRHSKVLIVTTALLTKDKNAVLLHLVINIIAHK